VAQELVLGQRGNLVDLQLRFGSEEGEPLLIDIIGDENAEHGRDQ